MKTVAKKAIAGFKIRKGLPIGCKVTLRKARMYEFLDRLVTIAMPRVRDFRGITGKGFDGRGNFAMGLKEQIIFPEINYDRVDDVRGMDIQFVTTAKTDAEAKALLKAFDHTFRQLSFWKTADLPDEPGVAAGSGGSKTGWPKLPRSTAIRCVRRWRGATSPSAGPSRTC